MVNYSSFNNYYEFLNYANSLPTDKEKLAFITDYIKYYGEYDYSFLLGASLEDLYGDVIADFVRFDPRGTYFESFPDHSQITHIEYVTVSTCSPIFVNVGKRINPYDLSPETIIKNFDIINEEVYNYLSNYISDSVKISYYTDEFMKAFKEKFHKTEYTSRKTKYVKSMGAVLIDMLLHLQETFEREYQNGLIVKGVCEGFADFVAKACEDLGIKCCKICSDTHAWNIVEIDNEFYMVDTTFENGKYNDSLFPEHSKIITKNTSNRDEVNYAFMTFEEFFKQYPDFEITEIGKYYLGDNEIINKDNYTDDKIMKVLTECFEDDVKERFSEISNLKTNNKFIKSLNSKKNKR